MAVAEVAPVEVTNGAPVGAPELLPPAIGERRAAVKARIRAGRAQTFDALDFGDEKKPEPKQTAPVETEEPDEVPDDVETESTDDVPDDAEVEALPAAKAKPEEPAVAKGLATIQAAEKKSREKLTKERTAFEQERTAHAEELKQLRARVAKLDELEKTAPTDPVGAFKALNIPLEHGARVAWQHHQAEKDPTNPQHREIAAKLQKDRASDDKLSATEQRLADLESKLEQKEIAEKTERETTQYFSGMAKAIETAETPLLKKALTKNPQGTWKKLAAITFELNQEYGELPDAADVLATYEKRRLEELEELDLAPPAAVAPNVLPTPKKNPQVADKKQPAKTLGTNLGAPRAVPSRSGKSEREHRAETLAMLESGKLE